MRDFFKLILNKAKQKRYHTLLAVLVTVLGLANQAYELINKTLSSKVSISIVCIIVFIFIKNIFDELLIYEYPRNLVKYAKLGSKINYVLLLVPSIFIISFLLTLKAEKNFCKIDESKIGLLIASFNKISNNDVDEVFSSTLYGKLNSELQFVDTINLRLLKKYISESNPHYLDSIKEVFSKNCSKKGLIVFGNRKDDKQFNCRLYSYNFLDLRSKGAFETRDSTIIYIQNPNIIDFTVESESNVISKFILGLLYYHAGKYQLSNESITQALNLNQNPYNRQFVSMCRLFKGNGFVCQGSLEDAVREYRMGIDNDPNNPFLRYNLAVVYNNMGLKYQAYNEYEKAHELKSSFENPIELPAEKNSEIAEDKLSNITNYVFPLQRESKDKNEKSTDWVVLQGRGKYGIFTTTGDTISNYIFDEIQKVDYKHSLYFVVRSDKKFGAFIKKPNHTFDEKWHVLPLEYSFSTIRKVAENCMDNHFNH